jgi:hypothetical protein
MLTTPNAIVQSIAMLEWASRYVDDLSWDDQLCALIVKQGNRPRLDYALAHGASWGPDTLTAAAGVGQMEILANFRLHVGEDCPWTPATLCGRRGGRALGGS